MISEADRAKLAALREQLDDDAGDGGAPPSADRSPVTRLREAGVLSSYSLRNPVARGGGRRAESTWNRLVHLADTGRVSEAEWHELADEVARMRARKLAESILAGGRLPAVKRVGRGSRVRYVEAA